MLQNVIDLMGVKNLFETSDSTGGRSPSRLIAIMMRLAFMKTTLAMPKPPEMKPSEISTTTAAPGASISAKMLMLGAYGGAIAPFT